MEAARRYALLAALALAVLLHHKNSLNVTTVKENHDMQLSGTSFRHNQIIPHRYFFKLYALDNMLDLKPDAIRAQLEEAMKGHILAESELMGRFERK